MGKIEKLQAEMQQKVDAAIEEKANEVLAILEAETGRVRARIIHRILATFHECGERLEGGYCPRCQR